MNRLAKISRQEFKMTAANRVFVILALTVLPGVLSMNSSVRAGTTVAIVGATQESAALAALLNSTPGASTVPFQLCRERTTMRVLHYGE